MKHGAVAELRRLQTRRETDELTVLRRCPKFGDYVKEYHAYREQVKDAKGTPDEGSCGVPLLIAAPGKARAMGCKRVVEFLDL